MKILLQLAAILGIYWLSQWIEWLLPFSFPASVISLILLLVLLLTKAVKYDHIRETADYILSNLAFFFVPVAVSIMKYADVIFDNLIAFVTISVVSMILTYAATAYSVQLTQRLLQKWRDEK